MIAAGIMILLGIVLDVAIYGFKAIHVLLAICGVFLVIVNLIGGKKSKVGSIGKMLLSIAAVAVIGLLLAGFFPSFSAGTANAAEKEIGKALQMAEKKGVAEAAAYLDEQYKDAWNRDMAFAAAELFRKEKNFDQAVSRFMSISSYVPYDIEVRFALAQSMEGKTDYNGAIDQLSYILLLDPENDRAYAALGDAYWKRGDNIRGIYYYKQAVKLAPDSVESRVKLAQAHANMHSNDEAMAEYRKAKDLAKTFEEEMLVYNAYTSLQGNSEAESASEAGAAEKEAGQ